MDEVNLNDVMLNADTGGETAWFHLYEGCKIDRLIEAKSVKVVVMDWRVGEVGRY